MSRPLTFWFLIAFFAVTFVMLAIGQLGVFDDEVSVQFGQHVPKEWIGETGVAIALGFNVGDFVQELLCLLAILGLFRRKVYGWVAALCEFSVLIYWSLTLGAYYYYATTTGAFHIPNSVLFTQYVLFLLYVVVGTICIFYLVKTRSEFVEGISSPSNGD